MWTARDCFAEEILHWDALFKFKRKEKFNSNLLKLSATIESGSWLRASNRLKFVQRMANIWNPLLWESDNVGKLERIGYIFERD